MRIMPLQEPDRQIEATKWGTGETVISEAGQEGAWIKSDDPVDLDEML